MRRAAFKSRFIRSLVVKIRAKLGSAIRRSGIVTREESRSIHCMAARYIGALRGVIVGQVARTPHSLATLFFQRIYVFSRSSVTSNHSYDTTAVEWMRTPFGSAKIHFFSIPRFYRTQSRLLFDGNSAADLLCPETERAWHLHLGQYGDIIEFANNARNGE